MASLRPNFDAQDCSRAMTRPTLLGSGSRQFMSFIRHVQPEFDSSLIYMDTLLSDCQEAIKVAEVRAKELEAERE